MNFDFLSDIKRELGGLYRSKAWPPTFLILCVLLDAVLDQWVIIIGGVIGFIYWMFFKRDR